MRRVCIVIGLQEDLDEVQREADEVAAAAKASGLFHEVHELIAREATVTTFRATIQQAVADLTNNSKLVIFYAGHGSLHDGFTWVKVGEDRIPLETEVLSQTSSYRALDVGFIFSCCQDDLKDPKSDRDTLPDLRQIAEDATVIKMYACPEGCKVVDSFLLGFAFAYHLRKKPRDLNSLLRFVRDDVLQLSMGHIEPHLDDGSSTPSIVLNDGPSDGFRNIMEKTQLKLFRSAFLLSHHVFEVVQENMKQGDAALSFAQARQAISDMADLVASFGDRVTNLSVQLSVLPNSELLDIFQTLEEWLQCEGRDEDVSLRAEDKSSFDRWNGLPAKTRDKLYSALRKVSDSVNQEDQAVLFRQFLALLSYEEGRQILHQDSATEQSTAQAAQASEVSASCLCIEGADGASFTKDQRQRLQDKLSDLMSEMGILDSAGFILAGSIWIVICTVKPLSAKQRDDLATRLELYVKECKNGKHGPHSALAWMFAKSVELVNSALVPISVSHRVRFARDFHKQIPAFDGPIWLDVKAIKEVVAKVRNVAFRRPAIWAGPIRVFQHGQELQDSHLLRNTSGLQITMERRWQDLTWPAGLEEAMSKLSQKQDEQPPWEERPSFQDFALAIKGLCSSADDALSGLFIQGVRDILQNEKLVDECKDPYELLTEVMHNLLASAVDTLTSMKAAIADLDRALQLEPQSAFALEKRGDAKLGQGKYAEAIADLDRALQLEPQSAFALEKRGDAKLGQGKYAEAIADLDRALQLDPQSAFALENRGDAKLGQGKYAEAIADLDRALQLDPQSAFALEKRGDAKLGQGKYAEAIADLDRALQLEPQSAFALEKRGDAKRMQGKYAEAIADLDRAKAEVQTQQDAPISQDPLEALEHPALKELHAQLAAFPLTLSSLVKALTVAPSMIDAPNFLAFVSVLQEVTRPVTTRGPSSMSSVQDEVDQEVAAMLEALPSNIENSGSESALSDFIAEWR
ncbi:SRFR1 [Symbiodinium natans]|uniref:SRFR1 protein n=1 Tax=Symbiodinium natans TaxID=878477 RepID=A0A812NI24_9DINO|nr:SRFR1 [Symbiodinium natans]